MSKIQESIPISLDKDYIHCVYVGMIGRSYDIATLIEAFSLVEEDNKKIMLHILGEGPDRKKLEKRIHKNIRFHGLLKYSEMISFVKSCDYLMNPIHSYAPQSVTNKLSDYILLRKPIINSQECAEVSDIINVDGNYFYKSGNAFALVNILNKLTKAPPNINYSSEVLKDFDRSYSYENLKEFIKSI
jgi:glycosyltransferase involved in cell wall biosynthesis